MRNHRNSPFFKIKRDTGVEKQCPCKPQIFSYTFVKKYDELGQTKFFFMQLSVYAIFGHYFTPT